MRIPPAPPPGDARQGDTASPSKGRRRCALRCCDRRRRESRCRAGTAEGAGRRPRPAARAGLSSRCLNQAPADGGGLVGRLAGRLQRRSALPPRTLCPASLCVGAAAGGAAYMAAAGHEARSRHDHAQRMLAFAKVPSPRPAPHRPPRCAAPRRYCSRTRQGRAAGQGRPESSRAVLVSGAWASGEVRYRAGVSEMHA